MLRNKKPVKCTEAEFNAAMRKDPTLREKGIVAQKRSGDLFISTGFLDGMLIHLDIPSPADGAPLLMFETMVFDDEIPVEDWRYATWEEAEAGHAAAVKKYMNT